MAGVLDRMRALGEGVAAELGFELVQVQFLKESGQWYLRFLLDRPGGIAINDCEQFSRRVEPLIDAADPIPHQYILEVSSAGLDRPLQRETDFVRFAGQRISIRLYEPLDGSKRFDAKLLGLSTADDGARVELEREDGSRVLVPLPKIAQARLIPDL